MTTAFNAGVTTGQSQPYVDRFANEGVLAFVGAPLGPFVGRDAISAAYVAAPPDDMIELTGSITHDSADSVAPYRWVSTGATGTMRLTVDGGEIKRLVVSFD